MSQLKIEEIISELESIISYIDRAHEISVDLFREQSDTIKYKLELLIKKCRDG